MNNVVLIGRITKELDLKYSQGSEKAVLKFSLAVDRQKKGEADFINCVAFGKTAEYLVNYAGKGKLIAVNGRIQTGSYEGKSGKVYTTDVIANEVQILQWDKENKTASDDDGFTLLNDEDSPW